MLTSLLSQDSLASFSKYMYIGISLGYEIKVYITILKLFMYIHTYTLETPREVIPVPARAQGMKQIPELRKEALSDDDYRLTKKIYIL